MSCGHRSSTILSISSFCLSEAWNVPKLQTLSTSTYRYSYNVLETNELLVHKVPRYTFNVT
jgi:hypothetical protein